MAKSSLAGADGALTWAVSEARAGGRIVRGPREMRAGAESAAGALSGCRLGLPLRAFSLGSSPRPRLRPLEKARLKLQGAHRDVGGRDHASL